MPKDNKASEEISFGEWLRQRRRLLDLTQQVLADQIGCARITLRRIEAGTLRPSKELASLILEKLGTLGTELPQWISFARGLSGFPSQSLPTSNKPKSSLPAPITTFIGREKEQSGVIRLIAKYRLVTLTGTGGIGKTRLSIEVGEQVLENYADGVWLVEFAPILDPLLVPRATAIAAGLLDEPQRPVIDVLCDYLRERKMLIILDNCEHLLDACAHLADTLLKHCPGLKILATSREALGILGEAVYRVPPLEQPDFQQVLEDFRHYESVRLFEERAQLAQINFSMTIENASSVAQICRRLDGIPLAIELAAAQVGTFSIEQLEKQLQDSFSLLTTGNRTALPRHQTLQAAIDWSYDLLSPAEKHVFQRLSIFVNGCTLEAAESICADVNIKSEAILDLLTLLIHKSLISAEEGHGKTRYHMLETMRQHANDKLIEVGESEALRDKHLEYFLKLAETAEPYLIRPEQIEWLPLLDADYENLRLALEWALSKDSPELSLRLCAALGSFWVIRSDFIEGLKWLGKTLSNSSRTPSMIENTAYVRALYQDARLANEVNYSERIKTSAELSLLLAQEGTDRRDTSIARFYVGVGLDWHNNSDEARQLMEQSLAEFRELNEPYWEAYAFRQLGYRPEVHDKLKRAEWYLQAVELARNAGERLNLANSLWDYSSLFYRSNRIDEAMKYVEEANRLYKEVGSKINWTSLAFGTIAWLNNDYEKAKSYFGELQERYGLLGEKLQRAGVIDNLGRIALEEGELVQAQAYFEEALATARQLENKYGIAVRLAELSNVFYFRGNMDKYKQYLKEGICEAKVLSRISKMDFLLDVLISMHIQLPEISAHILGAIYAAERENQSPIGPLEKRYYDRSEAHARETLGDVAFESAFADGQKMSLDEALNLALKTVEEV